MQKNSISLDPMKRKSIHVHFKICPTKYILYNINLSDLYSPLLFVT